ncbi:hypothetical protein OESDEN_11571 [Oesophagostomum dentatum]|uniref:Uncharacterized protein n=1 Tax=Oesophagostomum dentatum TaxID=61180 RepID=A0A0B1STN6_OESDE|nr:hypothetical protein OESDEN_11571 [Oesophagostomum dentatum]
MRETRNSPLKQDVFYFFLLNVSSAFMLSAAHNVLYFVLDIKTPVIHFLHHFFTFLFMALLYWLGCIPKGSLSLENIRLCLYLRDLVPGEEIRSRKDQRKTAGGCDGKFVRPKHRYNYFIPLALAASLSWLEFGQLEFSTMSFICAPLLAIARAVSLLTMQRAYIRCGGTSAVSISAHLEQFCMYYTGLTSLALFLPAFISYMTSHVEVDASWESIDYTLMSLSFLFMSCNLYSEIWLGLQLNARAYATLDHTKYLGGSIGQWIIQNMAHPNVIAFGGKVLTVACLLRIWFR